MNGSEDRFGTSHSQGVEPLAPNTSQAKVVFKMVQCFSFIQQDRSFPHIFGALGDQIGPKCTEI